MWTWCRGMCGCQSAAGPTCSGSVRFTARKPPPSPCRRTSRFTTALAAARAAASSASSWRSRTSPIPRPSPFSPSAPGCRCPRRLTAPREKSARACWPSTRRRPAGSIPTSPNPKGPRQSPTYSGAAFHPPWSKTSVSAPRPIPGTACETPCTTRDIRIRRSSTLASSSAARTAVFTMPSAIVSCSRSSTCAETSSVFRAVSSATGSRSTSTAPKPWFLTRAGTFLP